MSKTSGSGNIFDRLTNPKLYTGAHKHRFDPDGKGLGKAGRNGGGADDKVADLSQLTRSHLRTSAKIKHTPIDLSNVQKFGTQAEKAKFINVYTNGDPNSHGTKVLLGKAVNSWEKLLAELTRTLRLPTGPCKKLFKVVHSPDGNGHIRITKLEDVEDGALYLGCGAEDISSDKYPKALEK